MTRKHPLFVYSADFSRINDPAFRGSCLHLLCLDGEGSFVLNNHCHHIRRNDLVILTRPDQVRQHTAHADLRVEYFVASYKFLNKQLPANHFGIGGGISLYDDPILPLTDTDAVRLRADLHRLRDRLPETDHSFHCHLIGSLCLTLMYDLFDIYARSYGSRLSTDRQSYLVKGLIDLLETGITRTRREVAYFADRLHVTPKYLSETVRRHTGRSVSAFIDRYTVPLLKELLEDDRLSLTQIADRMNFSSASYFSRYVSKHLGVSPTAYRSSLQPQKSDTAEPSATPKPPFFEPHL